MGRVGPEGLKAEHHHAFETDRDQVVPVIGLCKIGMVFGPLAPRSGEDVVLDLAERAVDLKRAGLHRVNVSLDTLRPERFQEIARRGSLDTVLGGIEKALEIGLNPVKINCVAMQGKNADEAVNFARWTIDTPIHVRFIELMPIRWNLDETPAMSEHLESGLLTLRQSNGSMLNSADMRRSFVSSQRLTQLIDLSGHRSVHCK